jgi:hypothetical protein
MSVKIVINKFKIYAEGIPSGMFQACLPDRQV